MNQIYEILESLGLDAKEIALYLASLSVGEAGMSELAKKAKIKRTSAYLIAEELEKKGMLGNFEMKRGTRYVATPIDLIIEKTDQQLHQLKRLLPEIKAISAKADKSPKVSYYEGKDGYLLAAEDSLKIPNQTIRHIGSLNEIHRVVSYEYDTKHYIPTRLKQNIRMKALYFESEFPEQGFLREDSAELREIKWLPEEFIYNTSKIIYGDKVAVTSSASELITVIIESPAIAETERQTFEMIWSLIN